MSRIIVVHGEQAVLDSLRKLLSSGGHECVCTVSPLGALESAVAVRPDLVVIGARVSEMEGAKLLELMRYFLGARCPPVVVAPDLGGDALVAEISAALPTAFVFGSGRGPRERAA